MHRVALLALLFPIAEAGGATWTVDDNGPADFSSIQDAVDAASSGDVILVAPGTYTSTGDEVVKTPGKAITLRATGTPEETILDGEGARRVVRCSSEEGADTIIEGFTITGGFNDNFGGGIYCSSNSNPTITDCTISGNTATGTYSRGGGIYCDSSSPTISGCTILDNTANDG
ncbi:MAG: right-handed parallel beta-helix repeat-containing protein, partial [Phycisphaerales bacterium]|nr:right-handed parallel beta-helix repeat-containing protein [Phycisphaerales bacterium]